MEMISIKSPKEIEKMRAAGRLTAEARKLAGSLVHPGITTGEIDREVRRFIESRGGKPSFLGLYGFPASTCISVNEVVILLALKANDQAWRKASKLGGSAEEEYLKAVAANRVDEYMAAVSHLENALRLKPELKEIAKIDGDLIDLMEEREEEEVQL